MNQLTVPSSKLAGINFPIESSSISRIGGFDVIFLFVDLLCEMFGKKSISPFFHAEVGSKVNH